MKFSPRHILAIAALALGLGSATGASAQIASIADQPLANAIVPILLIPPPEFAQLDRFDVRLQGFPPL